MRLAAILIVLTALPTIAAAQAPATQPAKTLSLADALQIAERESESVGLAQSDLSRAEGERRRARSAYFPQLTGSASYTRTLRSQFSALQDDGSGPAEPVPEECRASSPVRACRSRNDWIRSRPRSSAPATRIRSPGWATICRSAGRTRTGSVCRSPRRCSAAAG